MTKQKIYIVVTTPTLKKSFLLPKAILSLIGYFERLVKLF